MRGRAEHLEVADELLPRVVPPEQHAHAAAERGMALDHRAVQRAKRLVATRRHARQHLEEPIRVADATAGGEAVRLGTDEHEIEQ